MMKKNNNEGISTIVAHIDLLGFSNLVATTGCFSSPVGQTAIKRIEILRKHFSKYVNDFPKKTKFFQINDLGVACLDIEIDFSVHSNDPTEIYISLLKRKNVVNLVKFISAVSRVHMEVCWEEGREKLGAGCRTFIVAGKRWEVAPLPNEGKITEILELQGNLAFAEAYQADSLGSKAGFERRSALEMFYINDVVWEILQKAKDFEIFKKNVLSDLDNIGIKESDPIDYVSSDLLAKVHGFYNKGFPHNLRSGQDIDAKIFYKSRRYLPLYPPFTSKMDLFVH